MNKKIRFRLVLTGILVWGVILAAWYAGCFAAPALGEGTAGPYFLVYRKGTGKYRDSAKAMDEVYARLSRSGVQATRGFGMYFDDPRSVPEERLRYIAGCVVDDIGKLPADGKDLTVSRFPAQRCLVAEFPYRNALHIITGVLKVYPRINARVKEKGYAPNAIMEIYDRPAGTIRYLMPLEAEADLAGVYYAERAKEERTQ